MSADRMIFTDCYPLKLIGMSNSTSADEEASVTKVVAGAKSGSSRTSGFVHLEEQLGLHKWSCYRTTHSDYPEKSAVAQLISPFVTNNCKHSTFIHFRHWNFAIFVDV